MTNQLNCFTAYDVRGRVPDELNEDIARRIGFAFAKQFALKQVVIGHDMRLSSRPFTEALIDTLNRSGVDVLDLGLCGTEEVYHAAIHGEKDGIDGGIMVTASHNPADYNGMKLIRHGARPVSSDSGLREIADRAAITDLAGGSGEKSVRRGRLRKITSKDSYINHLLSYVRPKDLPPLKLVVNAGNGCAGPIIDLLEKYLPFSFIKIQHQPDGTFPHGVPNPLLPEKRAVTADAVREHGADLGLAWDGDFDRCFFFDETGRFIEGYYIVGLLATAILQLHPGATILHDPRLIWNTRELVRRAGGHPLQTRTGHAFIKEKMRRQDAVYGGEMSAHHYFRDFGYCDSGMIPWLLACQLLGSSGKKLSELVDERMAAYPVSGEINSVVADPETVLAQVEEAFPGGKIDRTDGLGIAFSDFRFNLRKSNTEPVIRLNVETRGDQQLLEEKTAELLAIIR